MSEGTVNDQIVDSIASTSLLMGGQAPAQAFAMIDTVMAETLSMAMHNAVMRQQAASTVNTAAVTATCARMLQAVPPSVIVMPPAPPTPPVILPLKPTPPQPPSGAFFTNAVTGVKNTIGSLVNTFTNANQEVSSVQTAIADIDTAVTAAEAEVGSKVPPKKTT